MNIEEAIETWRTFKDRVNRESLDDKACHELFHDVMQTVALAVKNGEITYKEFHDRVLRS